MPDQPAADRPVADRTVADGTVDAVAFLGIDLGTSGLKAVILDSAGRTLGESEARYPVHTPGPDRAESVPQDWIEAMFSALRELAAHTGALPGLAGAAVAGQMHGTVLLAGDGTPVGPAILWPDRRAEGQLGRWRSLPSDDLARLANPLAAGMTGPVMSWLVEHNPDLVAAAETVVLPKDVMRQALLDSPGGPVPTDRSDASATLLWDVPGDRWSSVAASSAGIPARLLPAVLAATDSAGASSALQSIFGAERPVPVAIGAADTAAALLPLPRMAFGVNLGTGCQLISELSEVPTAAAAPSTHVYADAGGRWYAMAAIQNAGLALEWAASTLGVEWQEFLGLATAAAPGSNGVSFLPYLTGERGRIAPPSASAGWTGLSLSAGRRDLARAAFEGVVCSIRRAAELLLVESGIAPTAGNPVLVSGGGGRNMLLLNLIADALNHPVRRAKLRSATATGAAVVAARSVGFDLRPELELGDVVEPADAAGFESVYQRWTSAAFGNDVARRPT